MQSVTIEDLARLHTYLVVPLAVNEALNAAVPLEGDTQYALHVSLSEIEPDSAMLAIALSAQLLAAEFIDTVPVATALKLESRKIISEYGPQWLANYHRTPVQGDDLYELLGNVPEDLEALADLLSSLQASIRDETHPAFTLCSVLAVQARAHMEIADYVLTQLESDTFLFGHETADGVCRMTETVLYAPAEDNIVLFPLHRRR